MGKSGLLPAGDGEIPLTYLMHYLWLLRRDLQEAFDIQTPEGRMRLLAWYYIDGIREHRLPVTEADRHFLSAEARQSLPTSLPVKLTNLALLVWRFRDDVKAVFASLEEPIGQLRFVGWYYLSGIREQNLYRFLSVNECQGLFAPIRPSVSHDLQVPVWVVLAWLLEGELNARLNLDSPDACRQLNAWAEGGGRERYQVDALRQAGLELQSNRGIRDVLSRTQAPKGAAPDSPESDRMSTKRPGNRTLARRPEENARRPDAAPRPFPGKFGVNLVGYATGELGIGEDVRMLAKALDSAKIPFAVINRIPSPAVRQDDCSIVKHLTSHPAYPVSIVCMTGFDTAQLWLERRDVFEGKYVIGYWPWELPAWPEQWQDAYQLVDEIWASSRYTETAYSASAPIPVRFMPMAVTVEDAAEQPRSRYALPEDRFLFLFVFDFMSYPARKNPYACIAAFRKAFPRGDEAVSLVLKVSNVVESDPEWQKIKKACARDARILLIARTIDKPSVLGLMKTCDAYVSLHRAEGFGRTLAEAMLLGKPVIATDFSGNTDFLDRNTGYPVDFSLVDIGEREYPFCDGLRWAEPKLSSAAKAMRRVFDDRETARERGLCGREYLQSHHSPEIVGERVRAQLATLFGRVGRGAGA